MTWFPFEEDGDRSLLVIFFKAMYLVSWHLRNHGNMAEPRLPWLFLFWKCSISKKGSGEEGPSWVPIDGYRYDARFPHLQSAPWFLTVPLRKGEGMQHEKANLTFLVLRFTFQIAIGYYTFFYCLRMKLGMTVWLEYITKGGENSVNKALL